VNIVSTSFSGNNPDAIKFKSFTRSFIRVNTDDSNIQGSIINTETPKSCSYSTTLCADAGLPGTICTDRSTSLGVWCNASTAYPYISSIASSDCTNDNSNDYHINTTILFLVLVWPCYESINNY
jgi:hypothetical protein